MKGDTFRRHVRDGQNEGDKEGASGPTRASRAHAPWPLPSLFSRGAKERAQTEEEGAKEGGRVREG